MARRKHSGARLPLKLYPAAILSGRRDTCLDKCHALHTIIDGRVDHGLVWLCASPPRIDGICGLGVDGGEGFQISLRVTGRNTADTGCSSACSGTPAGNQLLWLSQLCEPEIVRVIGDEIALAAHCMFGAQCLARCDFRK